MKFEPGDIALMELGRFIDNSSFTRLVNVTIESVSHDDGVKALVRLLPPDPQRKDVLQAERYNVGRMKIIKTADLYRSKDDIVDSCEFRVGDVVMWCVSGQYAMATVLKVQKASARVINSEGNTFTAQFGNLMVVSRPNNEVDPGVTETEDNG